jgi:ribose-phosphate pyrophosphokinase
MVTLNLVNPSDSRIEYKVSKFPDGQQTIDLLTTVPGLFNGNSIQIKSRLNSFKDLELIICANQAIRNLGCKDVHLHVPYFLGSRSDRKFQEGGVNYLKQVICPIINGQNFSSVTVMDPHSDVLEACLNNFVKTDNHQLVKWSLTQIDNRDGAQDRICLVSPDAGAYKKIFDVAKKFKIERIITATKVRDMVTGNILRTEIPVLDQHNKLTYVIIDDICDGGRTFLELAKVIKEGRPTAKVYLIVTHGIFSAGFKSLNEYIDGTFCTNSYRDVVDDEYEEKTNVKCLNVF